MNIYRTIASLIDEGRDLALVTVLEVTEGTPGKKGFKMAVAEDGEQFGTVGGGALEYRAAQEAREVLRTGENRVLELDLAALGMQCGGRAVLVLERIRARPQFVLFGGGHLGRALAPLLEQLGYRVTIFDNRPEVRGRAEGPAKREVIIGDYADISPVAARIASGGCCFIATHGHAHDYTVLRQLARLKAEPRYIGMIGSKKKVQAALERLRAEGLAVPVALYAPVGLDLGGATVAEIAVAVAAELVALKHGRPVPHMRCRLEEAGDLEGGSPAAGGPAPGNPAAGNLAGGGVEPAPPIGGGSPAAGGSPGRSPAEGPAAGNPAPEDPAAGNPASGDPAPDGPSADPAPG